MTQILPVGKLPCDVLERLLAQAPTQDPHVLLGPGIGLDCAVVEVGDTLLVVKSDPITFATDAIGWCRVFVVLALIPIHAAGLFSAAADQIFGTRNAGPLNLSFVTSVGV